MRDIIQYLILQTEISSAVLYIKRQLSHMRYFTENNLFNAENFTKVAKIENYG